MKHKQTKGIKIAATIFLLYMLIMDASCNICENWIRNNEIKTAYGGYVIGKFLDTTINSRNEPNIIIRKDIAKTENYVILNIFMYNNIDSGDYVYKDSGSLKRFLVKGNDTIMYYPQCGDGNDVRD